ncbi:hypothetical protein PIB30_072127 [Stylosanthes scabra]|uniref:Uncharacterized protein n=1 Tax=Stylosanthes scabra TaxID=79078 RepID=A0ABU6VME2_9FABA|nr:hypothetical protein [Stylosanthes scabra]
MAFTNPNLLWMEEAPNHPPTSPPSPHLFHHHHYWISNHFSSIDDVAINHSSDTTFTLQLNGGDDSNTFSCRCTTTYLASPITTTITPLTPFTVPLLSAPPPIVASPPPTTRQQRYAQDKAKDETSRCEA